MAGAVVTKSDGDTGGTLPEERAYMLLSTCLIYVQDESMPSLFIA